MAEETIDILNDESTDEKPEILDLKEDDISEEKPEDKEEEIKLADETEDEDKDKDEKEEDKVDLVTPVSRKVILKKYPDLFKDFPYLDNAYRRDKEFSEIAGTPAEAKEAVEKAAQLDTFESHLLSGSTHEILKLVKEEDPESFNKIVDNYLPSLFKTDKDAYYHVLETVGKQFVSSMIKDGETSKDEVLQTAAKILNKYLFNTDEYVAPKRLSNATENTEADRLKQEREDFVKERFESANNDLNGKLNNVLKSTIDQNIDPKNSMTPYIKKQATRESMETLEEMIKKDTSFVKQLDKLWEKALANNFNQISLNNIRSFYLTKAKQLLPTVIKQVRNEALKGVNRKSKEDDEDEEKTTERTERRVVKDTKSNNSDKKSNPSADMRTIDFLNQD